jgi:hypothetical protein
VNYTAKRDSRICCGFAGSCYRQLLSLARLEGEEGISGRTGQEESFAILKLWGCSQPDLQCSRSRSSRLRLFH